MFEVAAGRESVMEGVGFGLAAGLAFGCGLAGLVALLAGFGVGLAVLMVLGLERVRERVAAGAWHRRRRLPFQVQPVVELTQQRQSQGNGRAWIERQR